MYKHVGSGLSAVGGGGGVGFSGGVSGFWWCCLV